MYFCSNLGCVKKKLYFSRSDIAMQCNALYCIELHNSVPQYHSLECTICKDCLTALLDSDGGDYGTGIQHVAGNLKLFRTCE